MAQIVVGIAERGREASARMQLDQGDRERLGDGKETRNSQIMKVETIVHVGRVMLHMPLAIVYAEVAVKIFVSFNCMWYNH